MLTGLCGKSWRQKYLPSDGHYTWEYFNADRDAESHRNCGYIGYFFFFHFSHFISLFALSSKISSSIINDRFENRPVRNRFLSSLFFSPSFFDAETMRVSNLRVARYKLVRKINTLSPYLSEKDIYILGVYSLKKISTRYLSSIERSPLFKSVGEQ